MVLPPDSPSSWRHALRREHWLWDVSLDLLPAAAVTAVTGADPSAPARAGVEGCARLIWHAWASGRRADAESALAATLNSAFSGVDPAMAEASAAQQQVTGRPPSSSFRPQALSKAREPQPRDDRCISSQS